MERLQKVSERLKGPSDSLRLGAAAPGGRVGSNSRKGSLPLSKARRVVLLCVGLTCREEEAVDGPKVRLVDELEGDSGPGESVS